jgi:hypothetical protein
MLITSYIIELTILLLIILHCIAFKVDIVMTLITLAVVSHIFSLIQKNLK